MINNRFESSILLNYLENAWGIGRDRRRSCKIPVSFQSFGGRVIGTRRVTPRRSSCPVLEWQWRSQAIGTAVNARDSLYAEKLRRFDAHRRGELLERTNRLMIFQWNTNQRSLLGVVHHLALCHRRCPQLMLQSRNECPHVLMHLIVAGMSASWLLLSDGIC